MNARNKEALVRRNHFGRLFHGKRLLVFSHDLAWVPLSVTGAFWLRFNLDVISNSSWREILTLSLTAIPVYGVTFWVFGCYRGIWRYASIPDLIRLVKAVLIAAPLATLAAFLVGRLEGVPRSVLLVYPFLLTAALATARITYRTIKDHGFHVDFGSKERAILVGAGQAGEMMVRDLQQSNRFEPVAFVDDDPIKYGHDIRGVRVRGSTDQLLQLVDEFDVQVVLITMPSAPRVIMNKIVTLCLEHGIQCRTLPALAELTDGHIEVSRLRPVTVEDLLGREPVILDEGSIAGFLQGKRVLVTGGGGSIGSELCRQIGRHDPGALIVLDSCEYNLYRIDHELSGGTRELMAYSVLGDVRDPEFIGAVFEQYQPQVVFHAAAYKHVPMVEDNVIEGIRNNVFGTQVVADVAKRYGVGVFVLISTDKTVNPTNVMGTTKRVAELYCQALNELGSTHFITTRFGNVLASAGSVVPLFERQIAQGGPVTVTHPEISRYFMTIPEAASLILQAGALGMGGEIFVLDMGEPVRIRDLAEKMIRLSGLEPDRDIQIIYTGLRPGEKLHEELFYAQEELRRTLHPKLLLAGCCNVDNRHFIQGLKHLEQAVTSYDHDRALNALKSLVPEFHPAVSIEQRQRRRNRGTLQLVQ